MRKFLTSVLYTVLFALMIATASGASPVIVVPSMLAMGMLTNIVQLPSGILASKLGDITLGVGVSTTIQLNYLPQYLGFSVGTTPTSIRINMLGKGTIVDLDAAGIDQMNGFDTNGLAANQFLLPLADGQIDGHNVEITIVNADAAGFTIYGWHKQMGLNVFTYQRQTILANSGVPLNKFALFSISAPGAADTFRVTYQSGAVSEMSLNELKYDVSYYQNNVGSIYLINNLDQIIKSITVIPSAQRTAYIMKYQAIVDSFDNSPVNG